jgi:hypothetical protein
LTELAPVVRARQLPLEGREAVDQLRRLERAVSLADGDLLQDGDRIKICKRANLE